MQYFGGKHRISRKLSIFLNSQLEENQSFVDLFCGSCNIVSKIDADRLRIANDKHKYLISMWKHFQEGGDFPSKITREDYYRIKGDDSEEWLHGFVGFGMSFGGKWWGGFTGEVSKNGQDYLQCAIKGVEKKLLGMVEVEFSNEDYSSVVIPDNSLIYCDIPYKGTTQYCKNEVGTFNHNQFYGWCKEKEAEGHKVLISEYLENVPEDAEVIWAVSSGTTNAAWMGSAKKTTEVVYRFTKER